MDTNVAAVANGEAEQAGPGCVDICIEKLEQIQGNHRLLLDNRGRILDEYMNRLSLSGQPGPGDRFFSWLWLNRTNERYCRIVPVTPNDDRGFDEFPDDPSLAGFDWDDRKFVAVAIASRTDPDVLNASDTDWWTYREPLHEYGVNVNFLCPELMGT